MSAHHHEMSFLEMRWLALFVSILFFASGCDSYTSRYGTGPIQVIGSSNELWLFIEVDRWVATSSGPSDTPRQYPVGHVQEMVVITNSGKVHTQKIPRNDAGQDGATFQPNIATLFRHDGSFYLFQGGSRDYRGTVFKWNGNRFDRLPASESDKFLAKHLWLGNPVEADKALKALTIQDGWQLLHSEQNVTSAVFNWNSRTVKISAEEKAKSFFIKIEANDFEPIVMKYPGRITKLSAKEFKLLSREERGHPRQK